MSVNHTEDCPSLEAPIGPIKLESAGFRHSPVLSHGTSRTGNTLIKGENLQVLTALQPFLANSIRCIYIDPPYNNGESYRHYDDRLSHDVWLKTVIDRIKVLRSLLSIEGSIWVSIDDSEVHYLKVAMDDIFGRDNFVSTFIWQHRTTRENRKVVSNNHEYILVYAKNYRAFKRTRNSLPYTEEILSRYKNLDGDPRGPWQSVSANVQDGHATPQQFYEIIAPNGKRHFPPNGRCWVYTEQRMKQEIESNNIWFGRDGNGVPRIKRFLKDRKTGLTPETLWKADDVGTTNHAKKHLIKMNADGSLFETPKPEQLLARIIQIATDPGDAVLDAYLGSGTTAATAHKMGRKYIGIENGDHIISHSVDRLKQVIEGETGGVSSLVKWKGGGGYDFYYMD